MTTTESGDSIDNKSYSEQENLDFVDKDNADFEPMKKRQKTLEDDDECILI